MHNLRTPSALSCSSNLEVFVMWGSPNESRWLNLAFQGQSPSYVRAYLNCLKSLLGACLSFHFFAHHAREWGPEYKETEVHLKLGNHLEAFTLWWTRESTAHICGREQSCPRCEALGRVPWAHLLEATAINVQNCFRYGLHITVSAWHLLLLHIYIYFFFYIFLLQCISMHPFSITPATRMRAIAFTWIKCCPI